MVGLNYGSNSYKSANMSAGMDFSIGYPYKVYLNLISTGPDDNEPSSSSDFRLNITYEKFDPNGKDPIPKVDTIVI
jgi:hypothetical protein